MRINSIGFFGKKLKNADVKLFSDSDNTARIQESHLFLGFILNEVENKLIKKFYKKSNKCYQKIKNKKIII